MHAACNGFGGLSDGYSLGAEKSLLMLNAGASFGRDVAGAKLSTGADNSLKKLVLSGQYDRVLGDEWVARLKAVSQLAGSRLPISELFALDGPDFGRAFLSASAQGDSALSGSAKISFKFSWLDARLAGLATFAFADDGSTWYRARPFLIPADYHLASAGAGMLLPAGDKTSLEVQVANALEANAPGPRTGEWCCLFGVTMM